MTLFRNTRPRVPILRHTRTIASGSGVPPVAPHLLLQSGTDTLLLETGDRLLVESGVSAALTALTAATLTTDDLFYLVDDPGGTPVSLRITAANLLVYLLA